MVDTEREPSDPPDPHRPNKFDGAASTWRDWTATERDISRSVDLSKQQDLAVHLYNSHALGLRAQRLATESKSNESVWTPSLEWTAWPMSAEEVPRLHEFSNDSLSGQSAFQRADRSREELRELLLAHMTKTARLRFRDRQCEGCDGNHSYEMSQKDQMVGPEHGTQIDISDTDIKEGGDPESPSSMIDTGTSVSPGIKDISDSEYTSRSTGSRTRGRRRHDQKYLEPVTITDDERAMEIARPSIEHIISSLEQLLHSLHTARQHYGNQPKSRADSRGPRKTSLGREDASQKSHGHRRRERTQDNTEEDDEFHAYESATQLDPAEDASDAEQTHEVQGKQDNRRRYNPGSWKDVLGVAAILGWDEEAVRRARDRCSILFDGTLPLVKLDLTPAANTEANVIDIAASEDEIEGGVHVDGFLRPVKRRKGWKGQNEQRGNWKSRRKAKQKEGRPMSEELGDDSA